MILILPAIDIKDGKCVRLVQGEPGTEKIYSDDPAKMAILWRGENAKTLHVVDLDGAFEGHLKNLSAIKKLSTPSIFLFSWGEEYEHTKKFRNFSTSASTVLF